MRVLVCGSRYYENVEHIADVLEDTFTAFVDDLYQSKPTNEEPEEFTLISGHARGVDKTAEMWARVRGISLEIYPADWDKYGKAAGPIRNKQMLDEGKPDMVLAFLAPNSRGTQNMIDQARIAGVPVEIIYI